MILTVSLSRKERQVLWIGLDGWLTDYVVLKRTARKGLLISEHTRAFRHSPQNRRKDEGMVVLRPGHVILPTADFRCGTTHVKYFRITQLIPHTALIEVEEGGLGVLELPRLLQEQIRKIRAKWQSEGSNASKII